MKAIKEDELDYSEFFFNVADKKGDWKIGKLQYNLSDDDIMDRCKVCGMKISEHRASPSSDMPATADDVLGSNETQFELSVPPHANRCRIGRPGFDTEVHNVIRECTPTEIQRSKALVLMNASGVGKTFATMTFRACSKKMSPRQPYECLTIYLGLSQRWDLVAI